MDKNKFEISTEVLNNLSVEDIVDLKVETDSVIATLDNVIETCNEALNS